MCDYSLQNVKTRPAKIGDKLFSRRFSSGTGGFSAPEDINVAVCLLPGTELSFAYEVRRSRLWPWSKNTIHHKTAIFRQVNVNCLHAHHDALEFPDGDMLLLTYLMEARRRWSSSCQRQVLKLRNERPTSSGVNSARAIDLSRAGEGAVRAETPGLRTPNTGRRGSLNYLSARPAPWPRPRPLSGAGGFNLSVLTVGAK